MKEQPETSFGLILVTGVIVKIKISVIPLEMSRYSARLALAGWATVRIILSYLFRSTVVFKLVELDTAVLCIPLVVYTVHYLKHAGKVF